jgi:beta-lactamase regulating signal transducer with metallopeptidase domain
VTGVLIGSSLLIVLVVALRALLRGRVSARLIYALWGVVLLRLLVPFSLDLDLPSAEGAARTVYGHTELSDAMLPYDSVSAPYAAGYSRSVLPEDDPIQPYLDAGEAVPEYRVELRGEGTPEAETKFVFLRPWAEVLSGYLRPVWLIGTLAALALLAYTNLSFWAKLRRSRRPVGVSDCGLTAYETDAIASPCLFGLFRPAVYVRAEDAERLRHVLMHEDCHFRHLDHIWALLRAACLAVYWWDPLVWLAAVLSRTDCELACDEAALSRLGETERIPYGETLITMAARPRPGELLRASSPIGSGKRELKARILAIARRGRRLVVPAVLAVCLCLFCAACAFTGADVAATAAEDMRAYVLGLDTEDTADTALRVEKAGLKPNYIELTDEEMQQLAGWLDALKADPSSGDGMPAAPVSLEWGGLTYRFTRGGTVLAPDFCSSQPEAAEACELLIGKAEDAGLIASAELDDIVMRSMLIGAEPVYGETCSFELIVKAKFSDGTTRDTAVSSDFAYVDGVLYRLYKADDAPETTPVDGSDRDDAWDEAWDGWEEDLEGLNSDWGQLPEVIYREGSLSSLGEEAESLLNGGTKGFFEDFEGGLVRVNVPGDACERITDLVRVRDALYYRAEGEISPEEAAEVLFTYLLESSNALPQEDFPFVIEKAEGAATTIAELDEDIWLVTPYLHFTFEGRGGNMSSGNMTLSGSGQYILMRNGNDWRLQLLDGLLLQAQYGEEN